MALKAFQGTAAYITLRWSSHHLYHSELLRLKIQAHEGYYAITFQHFNAYQFE